MIPSKDLFQLIKSMSRAEKTYFKKYTKLHTVGTENSYLLIFDAIAAQDVYDEKKVIAQLAGHSFVKHFAVVKNYLYERVLDSLENFHREDNMATRIRRAITRSEILHRRGLYQQSSKLLEKTRSTAKEFELNHALLEIYSGVDLILHTEQHDSEKLRALYDRTTETFDLIRENMLTHNLFTTMADHYIAYVETRDDKHLREAEKLVRSKQFNKAAHAKTFMGKLRFYETNFSYSYMHSNLEEAYKYENLVISLLDSNPNQLKNNVKKYLAALNNLFVIAIERNRITEAGKDLQRLKAAEQHAKTHSQKAKHYNYYTINSLHYCCLTANTEQLRKMLPSDIRDLSLYENEFMDLEKQEVYCQFAISWYYLGDLKKCVTLLNKLRNEFNLAEHPEVQSFLHLFYLIVNYDAGNREILVSAMQSYYRFLHKKKKVSEMELAIIAQLRKQSKIDSAKEIREQFIEFKKILLTIERSYLDKYIFKYVDFVAWLESKIEGKAFVEIVRRKQALS